MGMRVDHEVIQPLQDGIVVTGFVAVADLVRLKIRERINVRALNWY